MHEKIVAHLEEDIKEFEKEIQKDKALIEELKKETEAPITKEPDEEEGDSMDDYTESMDEFLDSLGGTHKEEKEKKPEETKPEEIRALG